MKILATVGKDYGRIIAAAVLFLVASVGCLYPGRDAAAAIPGRLNYQGKLTDAAGQLINQEYDISFSLFTAASGGASVWTETHLEVRIAHGLYNVMLGSIDDLTPAFQGADALWLEIAVNGETLIPRQEMVSSGYAIRTSGISVDPAGQVGIGTESPEAALHVVGEIESTLAGLTFHMVPEGAIMIWTDLLANIPAGWQLCDGTEGTPDLRDRFVYGTSPAQEPGATGGGASHTHSFSDTVSSVTSATGGHSHSYSQVPAHTHTVTPSGSTSSAGDHSHSATWGAGGSNGYGGNHSHNYGQMFSYGASSDYMGGWYTSGSQSSMSINSSGDHSHSYDIGSFTSGGASIGNHTHSVNLGATNTSTTGTAAPVTSAVSAHSHTLADATVAGTSGSADTLPSYIKMAFIMRMPR